MLAIFVSISKRARGGDDTFWVVVSFTLNSTFLLYSTSFSSFSTTIATTTTYLYLFPS